MATRAQMPQSELPHGEVGIDTIGRHALGGTGTDVCLTRACSKHYFELG